MGGHFNASRRHEGMLVPFGAEVGWYAGGRWKGETTALDYEHERIQELERSTRASHPS